ncbi:uncharacterized protein LOC129869830 [Solanum dulcamara]|uniref:uncharacterized protein LOC129869830 n=1 Tax=Solanum dulcamara TaxID=45834 RepID=UPI0024867038|nr:uncharacterized protein LOC129869830 [Solanum dulcamara]
MSELPNSITTWNDKARKFLIRFFPSGKTTKLRAEILSFKQKSGENLCQVRDRLKSLLISYPHHHQANKVLVYTFIEGLEPNTKILLESAIGGQALEKTYDELYTLLNHISQGNPELKGRTLGLLSKNLSSRILSKVKLPAKQKDPGSFTVQVTIDKCNNAKGLCDIAATRPDGIIEDMLVQVGLLIFPIDFVVLDFEPDLEEVEAQCILAKEPLERVLMGQDIKGDMEAKDLASVIDIPNVSMWKKNVVIEALERCMMAIFHDMVEEFVEIFIDDFSVFGESFELCLHNLGKVLAKCKEIHLILNWEKCQFFIKERIVLGLKVSKDCLELDKAKIKVIEKLPPPVSVKDIRSFLGHAGFYRRFMPDPKEVKFIVYTDHAALITCSIRRMQTKINHMDLAAPRI